MIDLILIVEDSIKFHEENLRNNLDHYSSPLIYFQLKKLKYYNKLKKDNKLTNNDSIQYNTLLNTTSHIITKIQENYKANFWFNAYVSIDLTSTSSTSTSSIGSRLFKYGIISEKDASKDLIGWENMYLAGRMHKPVRILQNNDGKFFIYINFSIFYFIILIFFFLFRTY